MATQLDIIIFGATGFTGKHTLPHIYKFTKSNGNNLSWGVAGRSQEKLNLILQETAKRIGVTDLNWVPVIIADVENEDSIKQMARQAKLIINCCGPYQLHGEIIVKACLESGTHLLDVSAEEAFTEGMVKKYDEIARAKNTYVVSACGLDCVPADLGVTFLDNNFNGTVNSVEVYVAFDYSWKPVINNGTWDSFVEISRSPRRWISTHMRREPNSEVTPTLLPKLKLRWCPFHNRDDRNKWALYFVGSDNGVIKRSQRYFHSTEKKRPIQTNCYITVSSFLMVLLITLILTVTLVLSQFKCGRRLLKKHPEFFSAGYFTNGDPQEKILKNAVATYTFYGVGWKEDLEKNPEAANSQPNKSVVATVGGKIHAYDLTCIALALSAIVLLTEKEKLPKTGGVYSTAAMFGRTSYIKQMQENGVNFEVISTQDI